ncbi:hypothetical protein [Helicobacter suis]|uniref:hypothetical protein n=1 Tax=Helicobacter suis TaxID=104628 RepID=UPI0013CF7D6B|nr:hypothetical protein [Helicobacter suis]
MPLFYGGGGGGTSSRIQLETFKKETLKKCLKSVSPADGRHLRPGAGVSEKHRQFLADVAYFYLLTKESTDSQEYPLELDLDPSLFHGILGIYIELLEDFRALFEELISLSHDLLDLADTGI